ncbi:MAG: ubiquinone/menaquinone biosynthesis methyltransferase [Gemmatimonadota bacterium]|nr:ubiquinone/menaquinone biosynthesis methyltransferase [Gemmatimonadota bacterium]
MPRLRDLDLGRHLADPALKPGFVTPMFDLVAPHYDDFTRLFSFGMDARWKAELLAMVTRAAANATTVLDVACGTGDLAFAVAGALPAAQVQGVDPATEMLARAHARRAAVPAAVARRVTFVPGDLGRLPAADASVDLVTAGYAFRNAASLHAALDECARVLRPGGVLASLDFYRPPSAPWRALYLGYLRAAGNLFGWWWHREPVAYGYIAPSIAAHVTAGEFAVGGARAGFEAEVVRTRLMGGIALHVLRRR